MQNTLSQTLPQKMRLLAFIILSIILFNFILAPGINILYYAADDFRYALGGYSKACSTDDGFYFVLTLGRPIQAYMDCLNYKLGYTLHHMSLIRFISAVLMGFAAGFFAEWLCCLGLSMATAFFAAGSVFLIPQLYSAAIIMGAGSVISPLVLVLLAYGCIQKERIVLSVILILCALLTYPAMTFFFGTLILTKVLFTNLADWLKTRREVLLEVIVFCISCLIYFIYAYFNMRYHQQAPVPDAYRLDHPNLNPVEILKRVVLLGDIFNKLWSFLPSGNMLIQGWITIVLLLGGGLIGITRFITSVFYKNNKKTALAYLGQAIISVVMLFVLSSAFVLVIPDFSFIMAAGEQWLLFGALSAGWALVFWSVWQWSFIFRGNWQTYVVSLLMGLFFLIEGYQANLYMMAKSIGLNHYLNYFQSIISDYVREHKQLRRIHFIVSRKEYPYDSYFSANASLVQILGHGKYELQWCSLPRGVPGEEKDHQKEAMACIKKLPENGIGVTYSYPDEPYQKTNSMLVIDIKNANNRADYYFQSLKQYFGIAGWPLN